MHWIAKVKVYPIWAALGPLVGVVVGAWLTARWQRREWIYDSKVTEYRGLLDTLNGYRLRLLKHHSTYGSIVAAEPEKVPYEDQVAMAEAQESMTNALADRLFTRDAIEKSGIREAYRKFSKALSPEKAPTWPELSRAIREMHEMIIQAAKEDLKLVKRGWWSKL